MYIDLGFLYLPNLVCYQLHYIEIFSVFLPTKFQLILLTHSENKKKKLKDENIVHYVSRKGRIFGHMSIRKLFSYFSVGKCSHSIATCHGDTLNAGDSSHENKQKIYINMCLLGLFFEILCYTIFIFNSK